MVCGWKTESTTDLVWTYWQRKA